METINVEIAFDNTRVDYVGTAMYSMLKNLEDGYNIDFYFITRNVTVEDIAKLNSLSIVNPEKFGMITCVDYDEYLENTSLPLIKYDKTTAALTDIVLARLYLFDIFPELNRVIHLDDDIIVCGSLSKYWNYKPEAPLLGTRKTTFYKSHVNFYNNNNVNCYANAGSLIFDLKYFRENNMFDKILEVRKANKVVTETDELLINVAYKDIIEFAEDNRFNFNPFLVEAPNSFNLGRSEKFKKGNIIDGTVLCGKDEIILVHFNTGSYLKPWNVVASPLNYFMNLWKKYNREYNMAVKGDIR